MDTQLCPFAGVTRLAVSFLFDVFVDGKWVARECAGCMVAPGEDRRVKMLKKAAYLYWYVADQAAGETEPLAKSRCSFCLVSHDQQMSVSPETKTIAA